MAKRRSIALGSTAMSTTKQIETIGIGVGFQSSVNGLLVEGTPELVAWDDVGRRLRIMEKGAQFSIGDYVVALEARFGEEASQILDVTEWAQQTLEVYRWLASSIAYADRRMDRLSISHHLLVAALPAQKQQHWLKKAADDENPLPWTVARLRQAMKAGEDLRPTGWWVLVGCKNEKDQREFLDKTEKSGRVCKAVVRRSRLPKKGKAKKVAA